MDGSWNENDLRLHLIGSTEQTLVLPSGLRTLMRVQGATVGARADCV